MLTVPTVTGLSVRFRLRKRQPPRAAQTRRTPCAGPFNPWKNKRASSTTTAVVVNCRLQPHGRIPPRWREPACRGRKASDRRARQHRSARRRCATNQRIQLLQMLGGRLLSKRQQRPTHMGQPQPRGIVLVASCWNTGMAVKVFATRRPRQRPPLPREFARATKVVRSTAAPSHRAATWKDPHCRRRLDDCQPTTHARCSCAAPQFPHSST
jgi:hypothetical protein